MKILILQGHGGGDPGAIAPTGQREDRTNWNVGVFVAPVLTKAGHDVYFGRRGHGETLTVQQRMNMIRTGIYGLVLSVHHNAGGGRGAEVLAQVKDAAGGPTDRLGRAILKRLGAELGQEDRGVKFVRNAAGDADYYGVLRAAAQIGIPAVIVEGAFMDTEYMEIDTYAEQEAEGAAIAAGVLDWLAAGM